MMADPMKGFSEQAPPASLTNDVEVVRITRHQGSAPFEVKTCPNGTPGMVFQQGDRGLPIQSIVTRSCKSWPVPELFLHGQGLEPSVMSFSGERSVILQVVLKPHGLYSIFGITGASLVLRSLGAEEFGGQTLLQALRSAATDGALYAAVFDFMEGRRSQSGIGDAKIESAIALVFDDPGAYTSERLAAELFMSTRQLQRRFLKVVGCPLKSFLRLRRANMALALLQTGKFQHLSDIAYQLDYADQSHFIRDIKEFTWLAPSQVDQVIESQSRDGVGFSFVS